MPANRIRTALTAMVGDSKHQIIMLFRPGTPTSARARALARLTWRIGCAGVIALLVYVALLLPFTPSITDLRKARMEKPSVLISVDGKHMASFKRFNREWVPLARISPAVVQALIATEDNRFYQHHGIDFYRLGGAVLRTLSGHVQGASTITQQLARNLYPDEIGRARSLTRKIKETITALKIEHAFTKNEILETYLNTVPFLYNAFGIEMAARTYFDQSAQTLSLAESATLIGMLKGASYYNPVFNSDRAVARRNVVLEQMVRRGALTARSFEAIKRRPILLDFERQLEARGPAPHFAEHLRKWLIDWADRHNYNIYADGLKVYTTIDSRMQAAANLAVKRRLTQLQAVADVEWGAAGTRLLSTSVGAYLGARRQTEPFAYFWKSNAALADGFVRESPQYRAAVAAGTAPASALARLQQDADFMRQLRADKTRLETGFLALDPTTGDIKAWVGSRDFNADQFDHVARAQRQPGSTFKPFVYGAALEAGMTPDQPFIDQIRDYRDRDGSVWQPHDIEAPSGRPMSAAQGLVYSKNTITAQVMQRVGPARVVDFARRAGVRQSRLDPVPSLALGTSPTTLLEMGAAYATMASGGEYRAPLMVTRVEDSSGKVLVEFSTPARRELSRRTAEALTTMLRGVVREGTGEAIRTQFGIAGEVAGKTGTTQDNTDGWFILMHPRLITAAWIGFNDARVRMRSSYWGQGAHTALPLVADFFQQTINSRMIDATARFPRARDAWFGASIWGPAVDWLEDVFGKGPPPPPSRPQRAPAAPPKPDDQSLSNEISRQIAIVKEALQTAERLVDNLAHAVDTVRRFFR